MTPRFGAARRQRLGLHDRVHRGLLALLDDVPTPATALAVGCEAPRLAALVAARFPVATVACAGPGDAPRWPTDSVDLVVWCRWPGPDHAADAADGADLADLRAALAPAGRLAVTALPTVLARGVALASRGTRTPGHGPDELIAALGRAGFVIEQAASVFPGVQLLVARA